MKMTASFLALACAATLPLASVAHAATSESATMVSAAQSQTILEVSASGKLSEIGAAVLGPDVRLTVRLHGPIAFDVDTANFASLEIYADDAAATLTVSEPTAYDRLTAVSFPKATGSSAVSVLAMATAPGASAGVATLAEGDTTTESTTPQNRVISVNFGPSGNDGTYKVSLQSDGLYGYIGMAPRAWTDFVGATSGGVSGSSDNISAYPFNPNSEITVVNDIQLSYNAKNMWNVGTATNFNVVHRGYLDDGSGVTIDVGNLPFATYDVYVYSMTDNTSRQFKPIKIRHPATYGGEDGTSVMYTAGLNNGVAVVTTDDTDYFGTSKAQGIVLNDNVICIAGQEGANLTIETFSSDGTAAVRSCVAAIQIVESFVESITAAEGAVSLRSLGLSGTATLEDGAVLTVDVQPNRLKVIGPASGTATLQIAMDNLDWSKIDLSEADNVTIELVDGCTTIPGGEWAVGDVKISTPVTLTVDSVATAPYWSIGGTLTIAEGGSLTVAVAEGVTVPNPYKVIQASSVPDSGIQSAGEAYKVSKVDNAYWLLGSGGLRAEVPAGTNNVVLWSELTWRDSVTGDEISDPVFATESVVTLVFSETSAQTVQFDGAKATEDGAEGNVTIDSLTVRTPTGVNPIISYGSDANNNRFWVNGRVTLVGEGAILDQPDTYPTVTMPIRAHAAIDANQTCGVLQLDKANLVLGTDAGLAEVPSGQTDAQFNGTWYRKNAISGNGSIRYDGIGTIFLNANINPSIYEEGVTFEVTNGTLQFQNAGRHYIDSNIIVGGGKTDATPTLALVEWNNSLQLGLESELLFKDGAKFLIKNGNGDNGGGRVTGGQIIIEAESKPVTFVGSTWGNSTNVSSPISGSGTLKFERDGGNPWTVSGKITDGSNGSLALRIACDIVSVTNTNNDFTGGVEIDVATKSLSPEVLGTGSIVVNTEGVLNLSSSLTVVKNRIIGGNGQIAGGVAFQDGSILDVTNGVLSIDALQMPTEAEGKITVRVTENADAGAAVLNVTGANAEKAKKFTTDVANTYIAASDTGFVLGKVSTANLPEGSTALANILAEAQATAIANNATSVELAYGQCGGETLTAAQAEAGAECFTNVTTTATEGTTTTVTVAYDFGISKMAIRDIDGTRYVVVGAKVQGAEGATTAADFADTTAVQVLVNGTVAANVTEVTDETGTTGGQSSEAGVKWFRLPYADVVGAGMGASSLTVKALPQTTAP